MFALDLSESVPKMSGSFRSAKAVKACCIMECFSDWSGDEPAAGEERGLTTSLEVMVRVGSVLKRCAVSFSLGSSKNASRNVLTTLVVMVLSSLSVRRKIPVAMPAFSQTTSTRSSSLSTRAAKS